MENASVRGRFGRYQHAGRLADRVADLHCLIPAIGRLQPQGQWTLCPQQHVAGQSDGVAADVTVRDADDDLVQRAGDPEAAVAPDLHCLEDRARLQDLREQARVDLPAELRQQDQRPDKSSRWNASYMSRC